MFKAIIFFTIPADYDWSAIAEHLAEHPLKPVGALELASHGFLPPYGSDHGALVTGFPRTKLITIGSERKILPAAAVRAEQAKRIKAIEEKEGRMPGGKTRKRILEDVIHEFLPRAFTKPSRLNVAIFADLNLIAVDTTSRKAAEDAISLIRGAMGSFPALPLVADLSIPSVLTGYIAGEPMADGLALGTEAWLESGDEATVKLQHHDLQCEEITQHLEAGKRVTRLELYLDDHLSFVLDDYLTVRKLKFLEGAIDQLGEAEDLVAELDARFALFDGEVRRLVNVLDREFKLFGEDDDLA